MNFSKSLKSFIFLFLTSIFFISCTKDDRNSVNNALKPTKTRIVTIDLPNYDYGERKFDNESDLIKIVEPVTKVLDNGEKITGSVFVTLNRNSEKLISLKLSENLLDAAEITQKEFGEMVVKSLGGGDPNEGMSEHTKCIEACKDKYTDEDGNKIHGRGACKANCWVDTALRTLELVWPF